jgi:GT2 family glycosyltransferase
MAPEDSPTLETLLEANLEASGLGLELGIIIQDNTPDRREHQNIPSGVRLISAPENPGLSSAYNRAIEIAELEGYEWLLTLDQDTILPRNFLIRVTELAKDLESTTEVGAIVPQVVSDGRLISPFRFAFNAVPRWFRHSVPGILTTATYAVNSAATLRVDALREVGGYDLMFPLDISDISLFHRLDLAHKKVFLAADLIVAHDFSMLGKQTRMSLERYRALLLDECAFWDLHMGVAGRIERLIRLAGRACKDLVKPGDKTFCRLTVAEILRRLTTSRKQRIAHWKQWAATRALAGSNGPSLNTPQAGSQRLSY